MLNTYTVRNNAQENNNSACSFTQVKMYKVKKTEKRVNKFCRVQLKTKK